MDVAHAPAAHFERGDEHGLDLADLGHAVQPGPIAEAEPKVASELLSDRCALGAGVDDEIVWAVVADSDRYGHPRPAVFLGAEDGSFLVLSGRRGRLFQAAGRRDTAESERGDW